MGTTASASVNPVRRAIHLVAFEPSVLKLAQVYGLETPHLRVLYRHYMKGDKNGDGCLSGIELANVFKCLHREVASPYFRHLVTLVDKNDDHSLDFTEFVEFVCLLCTWDDEAIAQFCFHTFDRGVSGVITPLDFHAVLLALRDGSHNWIPTRRRPRHMRKKKKRRRKRGGGGGGGGGGDDVVRKYSTPDGGDDGDDDDDDDNDDDDGDAASGDGSGGGGGKRGGADLAPLAPPHASSCFRNSAAAWASAATRRGAYAAPLVYNDGPDDVLPMRFFDRNSTYMIDHGRWAKLVRRCPHLLLPCRRMQAYVRAATFGNRFWRRKIRELNIRDGFARTLFGGRIFVHSISVVQRIEKRNVARQQRQLKARVKRRAALRAERREAGMDSDDDDDDTDDDDDDDEDEGTLRDVARNRYEFQPRKYDRRFKPRLYELELGNRYVLRITLLVHP
jgi:Ca2+-binding EF-hand superfamily protein